MTKIVQPLIYFNDPTTSRALFNGEAYYGVPDTDPTQASNQKLVRAVQENGSLVSLTQPININSGGNPTYNGSPVVLDVDGDYSYRVNDRLGAKVIYVPRIENPEPGSEGFSGVVAIEDITLSAGQTTVVLSDLGAQESVFVYSSAISDSRTLVIGVDYTITNSTTIELSGSYNAGDIIQAKQWDTIGQLVPVNEDAEALLVFADVSAAQTAAVAGNLVENDTVTLNGNATDGDGLGGDKYKVIATAFANDGVNYIDLNGTLQLQLQNNYYRFQNYSETIGTPQISAGNLNVDLNEGVIQEITIGENISGVTFLNFNPTAIYSSTVTLKISQDGIGGFGLTWPASIVWAGGVAPTLTNTASATDVFGFTTHDAGVTWYGFTLGQDFS